MARPSILTLWLPAAWLIKVLLLSVFPSRLDRACTEQQLRGVAIPPNTVLEYFQQSGGSISVEIEHPKSMRQKMELVRDDGSPRKKGLPYVESEEEYSDFDGGGTCNG
jgi:hypothetical protein